MALVVPIPAHAGGARLFKSGPIQITADGAWVWTVNPDDDSVSRLETSTEAVTRFPLAAGGCDSPEGISVREDGAEIWVACRESDRLVVLAGVGNGAGSVLATVMLPRGSSPLGVALSRDQRLVAVTLSRLPGVAVVDTAARAVTDLLEVQSTPLGIAWAEDGRSAWITHLRRLADFGFITRIDVGGPRPVTATELFVFPAPPQRSARLADPDPSHNVAEGGYLSFRGQLAQVPSVTGRREMWIPTQYGNVHEDAYPSPPDSTAQSSVRHLRLDTKTMPETLADKVILSAAQVHDPTNVSWVGPGWDAHVAGPIDVGFSSDGATTCVLHELSGDLVVFPTSTPPAKPSGATPPLPEIPVGARPMGLAMSPTSDFAYVMNRLGDPTDRVPGRTVSIVDLPGLRELRQVSVAPETQGAQHVLGARLFHSSDDPRISAKQKAGCATCHPHGEDDSSQWDMQVTPGEHGPRMAPSLLGVGLTMTSGERDPDRGYGLLHHSGDRDEVQDFDFTFSGVQLGGTGFLGGSANAELGPPNAGLSAELDALAEYVLSLEPMRRSPHRAPDGRLTAAAIRGATFFSGDDPSRPADAGCATCHDPRTAFVDHRFHDVGQLRSTQENELNRRTPPWEVKTQSLIGAWATPPYEGVADVIGQVFGMMEFLLDVRGRQSHGRVAGLTGRQLKDLETFILSIDGDMTPDEVLLARDTAPPRITRLEPASLSVVDAWFDESVDPATAADPSNWLVLDESGARVPVTSAVVDAQNGDLVRLAVALRAGCPPPTYVVTASGIRDLADRASAGVANAIDPLDPANTRTFTIGETITVTLGASGYENLTVPVHDSGMYQGDYTVDIPNPADAPTAFPFGFRRGLVRFEWRDAFAALTGLASSADIVDASFSLQATDGDAHDVVVRRVLQSWQDSHVRSSVPPPGAVTYRHHRTPSDLWNMPGASMRLPGVDGDDPSDYDGGSDVADTPDAQATVLSVKERAVFAGPRVTEAYRYWFDHPANDYGHALELAPGSVRELNFDHAEARLHEDGPVLTITYRVAAGVAIPREVSAPASGVPLLADRVAGAADSVALSFEDLGAPASSYSVYAGDIGTWYSHGALECALTPGASGGRRATIVPVPGPSRYLLVTAANACAEGASGSDSFGRAHPAARLDCPP